MFKRFNINSDVKVKLTKAGRDLYFKRYRSTVGFDPPNYYEDKQGYTIFQLWVLMEYFGKEIWHGSPCYFEGNIIYFNTKDFEKEIK